MARTLSGLIDAQAMARKHPDSFDAPKMDELQNLTAGDLVKICRNSERFWVIVTDSSGGFITGLVNNHLISNRLPVGTEIRFPDKSVFDYQKGAA